MTSVSSMNPFSDSEGDVSLWESDRCIKTCRSDPEPPCSPERHHTPEPPGRTLPDPVPMSMFSYFKRKFVDDEDEAAFSFRTYCQAVAPVSEERSHVSRSSSEKMRFSDDPEAFSRRSVLVNNSLRRSRADILLQSSDWFFRPAPPLSGAPSCPPVHPAVQSAAPARICLPSPSGPSLRKRLRTFGPGQELRPRCAQTCCCIYAAGHVLHSPSSVYDAAPSPPSTSSSHSAVDDGEEEPRGRGSSAASEDRRRQKSRTKDRRTEDGCMAECVEEEEEEEEEEGPRAQRQ